MIWNHPAALFGLVLVAGPLLVHLLVRQHAVRVLFPGMRFVPTVRAAAVRLRAPSDAALMALRMAIVVAAVLAVAQPLLSTASRRQSWDARVARAVIVDTSASVPAADATRLAEQASAGAFVSHRFATADLRDAVRRAGEWLATSPAARREIVIVSDFQRGAIDGADLAGLPTTSGIVPIRAGRPAPASSAIVVDGWRGGRWDAAFTPAADSTQVTWTRRGDARAAGLTVRAGASDQSAVARAEAAARSFGAPASAADRSIDVAFEGATPAADTPPMTPWIVSAAVALRTSPLLADAATEVHVGERDGTMTVRSALSARSPLAPAVVRAALVAASPRVVEAEAEPAAIDDAVLSRWRRDAAPVTSGLPRPDQHDGRWLWALALVLLIFEGVVRRRASAAREVHADAA